MTSIITIPSVIYLVLMTTQVGHEDTKFVIQEMPTMHMCESVGEWIKNVRMDLLTIYTCIESPRDE